MYSCQVYNMPESAFAAAMKKLGKVDVKTGGKLMSGDESGSR